MTIFIGGARPYTNESLHLRHVAALLPGAVPARYTGPTGRSPALWCRRLSNGCWIRSFLEL